jgi:hypothetical protein
LGSNFDAEAVPKRILELMGVQGLTRENVASHLQVQIKDKSRSSCMQFIVVYSSLLNSQGTLATLEEFEHLSVYESWEGNYFLAEMIWRCSSNSMKHILDHWMLDGCYAIKGNKLLASMLTMIQ